MCGICGTLNRRYAKLIQFVLVLVIMATMTGCAAMTSAAPYVPITIADGQVLATSPGTTLWGVAQALAKAPGTAIFTDPGSKVVLFAWPVPEVGNAWVQMPNIANGFSSFLKNAAGKGSIANNATWTQLRTYLEEAKWITAAPYMINPELIASISAASTTAVASNALMAITLVPAETFDAALQKLKDLLQPQIITAIFHTS